jgi:hypothetical protein
MSEMFTQNKGMILMNGFGKTSLAALAVLGVALGTLAVTAPADAGVSIGIGVPVGGYGYHRHWCYNHPGACGYARPAYAAGYYGPGYAGPRRSWASM